MGKFNLDSLKGYNPEKGLKVDENQEGERKVRLGEGLLNEASKDIIKMRIVNLEREKIKKNPKNNYSIGEIESLAESIRVYGITAPLNVRKIDDDLYMLLGGERRITAIDKLIDNPNVPEWNEDTLIPCVIKDLDKINLPLSDENKENYAIVTTNKESRKYTDGDRYTEIQTWKKIIEELRANGVETINSEDEYGEKTEIQIKGKKTREILENTTGMSRGQINKFEKVENNGTDKLVSSILDNDISVGIAEKAVDILTPEEQDRLADEAKKRVIKPRDVESFKKEETKTELTFEQFSSDIKKVSDIIKESKVYLSEKDEKEYYKILKKLENILSK